MKSTAIQRNTLDTVTVCSPDYSQDVVAPQTTIECTLVEIWSQVLNIPYIGIHHNFFDMGGNALRCLQVQSIARTKGFHFPPQKLYQYPTIHTLTQALLE